MKVNIYELNDDLDDPFEIMFPTLVYFFMTNHYEEKGYTNYYLFSRNIKSRKLVSDFDDLKRVICKVIDIKLNLILKKIYFSSLFSITII